jgi:hypothetical protein
MFATPTQHGRQLGVSLVLIQVIEATRAALVLGLLALAIVVVAGLTSGGMKFSVQYGATAVFIGAWMVVKNGIIQAKRSWRQQAWQQAILVVVALYALAGLAGALALWAAALGQQASGTGAPGLLLVAIAIGLLGGRPRRGRRRRW